MVLLGIMSTSTTVFACEAISNNSRVESKCSSSCGSCKGLTIGHIVGVDRSESSGQTHGLAYLKGNTKQNAELYVHVGGNSSRVAGTGYLQTKTISKFGNKEVKTEHRS